MKKIENIGDNNNVIDKDKNKILNDKSKDKTDKLNQEKLEKEKLYQLEKEKKEKLEKEKLEKIEKEKLEKEKLEKEKLEKDKKEKLEKEKKEKLYQLEKEKKEKLEKEKYEKLEKEKEIFEKIEKAKKEKLYELEKEKLEKEKLEKEKYEKEKLKFPDDKEMIKIVEILIQDHQHKHKAKNYEKIPDYVFGKENDKNLKKTCNSNINVHSIELPLIIIDNKYYEEFCEFLEDYAKYSEYESVNILKEKLLIKLQKLNTIFHQKEDSKKKSYFFAEVISSSIVNFYTENEIKDFKEKIISYEGFKDKDKFDDNIKKWIRTVFNIMTEFILFNLKNQPLYFCCDKCLKPILYQEIFPVNEKNKNNKNNIAGENNIININNNNNNIDLHAEEEKKENDKKLIDKIFKDDKLKYEFKSLLNVANNMINILDFQPQPQKTEINKGSHHIANPPKKNENIFEKSNHINVIYYNENQYADIELFERYVSGAFAFIYDFEIFKYLMNSLNSDNAIEKFILIVSGQSCEKIINYLNASNFLNKFQCCLIFTQNNKYDTLKSNYPIIKEIIKTKKEIIKFFNNYKNEKGIFLTFKVINIKKYFDYYFKFHKIISSFYGTLSPNLFEAQIQIVKEFLKIPNENSNNNNLIHALRRFKIQNNDYKFVIQGYTNQSDSYYEQFNMWMYSYNTLAFQKTGYFLSGLIECLNKYGDIANTGIKQKVKLYRGAGLYLIDILPYKNNVDNIIIMPNFLSTSVNIKVAKDFASSHSGGGKFYVIYTINYNYESNWMFNTINVEAASHFSEEERLFQPFSFFKVKKVDIDLNNEKADIELDAIGKTSILEEAIKDNKKIKYNYAKNIIEPCD